MRRALVVVARTDLCERGRHEHTRWRELELLEANRSLDLAERNPQVGQPRSPGAELSRRGLLVLEAPPPVLAPANLHRASLCSLGQNLPCTD